PGFDSNLPDLTGYKFAWRQNWRERGTGYTAFERVFANTFGAPDTLTADAGSPIDSVQLHAISMAGTRIVLSIGTQDQYQPVDLYTRYANKARALNIPLKVRINYRSAHCGNANIVSDAVEALTKIHRGDASFLSEVEYYSIKNP